MPERTKTYTLFSITIFISTLIAGFKSHSTASLAGTRWTGTLNLHDNHKERGLLVFKKDSLVIYVAGQAIETTRYTLNNDTMVFKNISGGSPCKPDQTGKYLFAIQSDILTLTPMVDNCQARINMFSAKGYQKYNNEKKKL